MSVCEFYAKYQFYKICLQIYFDFRQKSYLFMSNINISNCVFKSCYQSKLQSTFETSIFKSEFVANGISKLFATIQFFVRFWMSKNLNWKGFKQSIVLVNSIDHISMQTFFCKKNCSLSKKNQLQKLAILFDEIFKKNFVRISQ